MQKSTEMNIATVSPSKWFDFAKQCINADIPLMTWGKSGAGKSDMLGQLGEAMGFDGVIDIRLSITDPSELKGVPVPVRLEDGTVVRADDVTQENVRPRKVVIVGDTCDASSLVPLAENADLVVHEATLEDEQWILARRHGHSTAGGAGRFAAKAKAKALILTHMSSRHHSVKHLERLREQARKSFGRQEVVLGRDFMAVPVPRGGFTT